MKVKCPNCPNTGACYMKVCVEKPKKIMGLRQRSAKREVQEKEYTKLKKLFLMANPKCQFEGCGVKSVDVHHKKGREGSLLTDMEYFMAVCRKHHTKIELEPDMAFEKGYSIHRYLKAK